jgi:ankyrin repeat protein
MSEASKQLYSVCYSGDYDRVCVLLKGPIDIDYEWYGDTSLYIACKHGFANIVEALVNHGADINKANISTGYHWSITPLCVAAGNGHIDIVRFLLDHGADMNIHPYEGITVKKIAKDGGHGDIVDLLTLYENSEDIKEPDV